ncbi:MAG: adenylosuccinate synthase [Spirochaetales bacterium]|nr:adenylosuccinate synthase [Spirochaetales bacterium]
MSVTAIVGANWGDEGKGKITDYLAQKSDFVCRFQGGKNAGHTIINNFGKFALHLLPSGVFYQNVTNVLGPGVALDISAFIEELNELETRNVPAPAIRISNRVQVVLPYHILFDMYEEERLGKRQFGSTKSGIAPFYSDKYHKIGIQVMDMFDEKRLAERLQLALERKNVMIRHLYDREPLEVDAVMAEIRPLAEAIRPFLCDTLALFHGALAQNKMILLEGQLGALRDPDYGIYPFSTSSSTLAGFAAVGAGIPPYKIEKIIAVTKAYSTCVGAGPFVTEIKGDEADELRKRGGDAGEYGATTGRPRRMGWFDTVATKYGCKAQGATEVELSMLDVLGYRDEIPVCFQYEIDGERTDDFPVTSFIDKAVPVYKNMAGWKKEISHIRTYDDLPDNARRYVETIEESINVPITWISVGPKREEIICRQ